MKARHDTQKKKTTQKKVSNANGKEMLGEMQRDMNEELKIHKCLLLVCTTLCAHQNHSCDLFLIFRNVINL